jgi:hypothetical protein
MATPNISRALEKSWQRSTQNTCIVLGEEKLMALLTRVEFQGTFAQNVEWLTPDYVPQVRASRAVDLVLQLQSTTGGAVVELTLDGILFFALNGGNPIPAGFSQFDIFCDPNSAINFRTPDVAGISIRGRLVADLDG